MIVFADLLRQSAIESPTLLSLGSDDAIEAPDWVAIPLAIVLVSIVAYFGWRQHTYHAKTTEAIRVWARHRGYKLSPLRMKSLGGVKAWDSRDRDSILRIEVEDEHGLNRSGWLTPKPPTEELPLGDFEVKWE